MALYDARKVLIYGSVSWSGQIASTSMQSPEAKQLGFGRKRQEAGASFVD